MVRRCAVRYIRPTEAEATRIENLQKTLILLESERKWRKSPVKRRESQVNLAKRLGKTPVWVRSLLKTTKTLQKRLKNARARLEVAEKAAQKVFKNAASVFRSLKAKRSYRSVAATCRDPRRRHRINYKKRVYRMRDEMDLLMPDYEGEDPERIAACHAMRN